MMIVSLFSFLASLELLLLLSLLLFIIHVDGSIIIIIFIFSNIDLLSLSLLCNNGLITYKQLFICINFILYIIIYIKYHH